MEKLRHMPGSYPVNQSGRNPRSRQGSWRPCGSLFLEWSGWENGFHPWSVWSRIQFQRSRNPVRRSVEGYALIPKIWRACWSRWRFWQPPVFQPLSPDDNDLLRHVPTASSGASDGRKQSFRQKAVPKARRIRKPYEAWGQVFPIRERGWWQAWRQTVWAERVPEPYQNGNEWVTLTLRCGKMYLSRTSSSRQTWAS